MNALLPQIKSYIKNHFLESRILLFGSRSKNNHLADSDYDFIIITKNTLSDREKLNWMSKIRKDLIKFLDAPVDVLLNSEEEIIRKKNFLAILFKSPLKKV